MLRAFLFDMDGVIVDSTELHTETWRLYLQQHGVTTDGIRDKMLGMRNDELVPLLFGDSLTADEITAHGAQKEELYRQLLAPRFEESLVPGVVDFLRSHTGVPKALATNAEPRNVDFILSRAGLDGCFQAIVDGHQVERPKPAPDIYVRAAELLGAAPHECVVFEDSLAGIEAGRASGARVVALTTSFDSFDDVDLVIRDFHDPKLEPWLQSVQNGA